MRAERLWLCIRHFAIYDRTIKCLDLSYSENLGFVEDGVVSAEGWNVVSKLGMVHWAGW